VPMALVFSLFYFSFYHNTVPMVLKAPEERYYGNPKNIQNRKSAIGTTL